MVIEKRKPYRSKMFLAFCHEQMKPSMCCVCENKPWTQLHHWGDDGGMALKPGDLEVARVCTKCHSQFGHKKKALILAKGPMGMHRGTAMMILRKFYADALKLQSAYIQHLEGKRRVRGCARDELLQWRKSRSWIEMHEADVDWLVQWADRRAAELFDQIDEP